MENKTTTVATRTINVREIISNVLQVLDMSAPAFFKATGIAYQRIFDLQRGRTQKFNPNIVNLICTAFPQINKTYLYTGEGSVLNDGDNAAIGTSPANAASLDEITKMLNRALDIAQAINNKYQLLFDKQQALLEKEQLLMQWELRLKQESAGDNPTHKKEETEAQE